MSDDQNQNININHVTAESIHVTRIDANLYTSHIVFMCINIERKDTKYILVIKLPFVICL